MWLKQLRFTSWEILEPTKVSNWGEISNCRKHFKTLFPRNWAEMAGRQSLLKLLVFWAQIWARDRSFLLSNWIHSIGKYCQMGLIWRTITLNKLLFELFYQYPSCPAVMTWCYYTGLETQSEFTGLSLCLTVPSMRMNSSNGGRLSCYLVHSYLLQRKWRERWVDILIIMF